MRCTETAAALVSLVCVLVYSHLRVLLVCWACAVVGAVDLTTDHTPEVRFAAPSRLGDGWHCALLFCTISCPVVPMLCCQHDRARVEAAGGWITTEIELCINKLKTMNLEDPVIRKYAEAMKWVHISRVNSDLSTWCCAACWHSAYMGGTSLVTATMVFVGGWGCHVHMQGSAFTGLCSCQWRCVSVMVVFIAAAVVAVVAHARCGSVARGRRLQAGCANEQLLLVVSQGRRERVHGRYRVR